MSGVVSNQQTAEVRVQQQMTSPEALAFAAESLSEEEREALAWQERVQSAERKQATGMAMLAFGQTLQLPVEVVQILRDRVLGRLSQPSFKPEQHLALNQVLRQMCEVLHIDEDDSEAGRIVHLIPSESAASVEAKPEPEPVGPEPPQGGSILDQTKITRIVRPIPGDIEVIEEDVEEPELNPDPTEPDVSPSIDSEVSTQPDVPIDNSAEARNAKAASAREKLDTSLSPKSEARVTFLSMVYGEESVERLQALSEDVLGEVIDEVIDLYRGLKGKGLNDDRKNAQIERLEQFVGKHGEPLPYAEIAKLSGIGHGSTASGIKRVAETLLTKVPKEALVSLIPEAYTSEPAPVAADRPTPQVSSEPTVDEAEQQEPHTQPTRIENKEMYRKILVPELLEMSSLDRTIPAISNFLNHTRTQTERFRALFSSQNSSLRMDEHMRTVIDDLTALYEVVTDEKIQVSPELLEIERAAVELLLGTRPNASPLPVRSVRSQMRNELATAHAKLEIVLASALTKIFAARKKHLETLEI